MAAHARLKNEFTEGGKYHNLMSWLNLYFAVCYFLTLCSACEPPHDKTYKVTVRPVKTEISLGIRPVWSESSLSAWRKIGSLATHWAHSEDSDQTGRIWVFAWRTLVLLVLSCRGSFIGTFLVRCNKTSLIWSCDCTVNKGHFLAS